MLIQLTCCGKQTQQIPSYECVDFPSVMYCTAMQPTTIIQSCFHSITDIFIPKCMYNIGLLFRYKTGAHSLGKCHRANQGFEGPWDFTPVKLENGYYQSLVHTTWIPVLSPGGLVIIQYYLLYLKMQNMKSYCWLSKEKAKERP